MTQIPVILVTDPLIGVRGALATAKEVLAETTRVTKPQTKQKSPKRPKR
jgi:hypothetical protein